MEISDYHGRGSKEFVFAAGQLAVLENACGTGRAAAASGSSVICWRTAARWAAGFAGKQSGLEGCCSPETGVRSFIFAFSVLAIFCNLLIDD